MFGVETVERYLHSSYDQFAGRATVPNFLPRRYEEWVLDDPAGLSLDQFRPIRDDIERRVRDLLTELDITATA